MFIICLLGNPPANPHMTRAASLRARQQNAPVLTRKAYARMMVKTGPYDVTGEGMYYIKYF